MQKFMSLFLAQSTVIAQERCLTNAPGHHPIVAEAVETLDRTPSPIVGLVAHTGLYR
jgi:hypothetical protein